MAENISESLLLLVGRIDGKLDTHIASVVADRATRAAERTEDAKYRQEIRHRLNNLDMAAGKLPPLADRVEAVEGTAEDWKKFRWRLAGAILVIGIVTGLLSQAMIFFAPAIKALFLRAFGVF